MISKFYLTPVISILVIGVIGFGIFGILPTSNSVEYPLIDSKIHSDPLLDSQSRVQGILIDTNSNKLEAENLAEPTVQSPVLLIQSKEYSTVTTSDYAESPQTSSYQNYSSYNGNFQSAGVVYGDDGTRYTWYSQNVLPGGGLTELNENGRYVDENGYVRDGDGYIAVASSDHEQGTVLDTPFGAAKVYDSGCDSGTIDVYTDF